MPAVELTDDERSVLIASLDQWATWSRGLEVQFIHGTHEKNRRERVVDAIKEKLNGVTK